MSKDAVKQLRNMKIWERLPQNVRDAVDDAYSQNANTIGMFDGTSVWFVYNRHESKVTHIIVTGNLEFYDDASASFLYDDESGKRLEEDADYRAGENCESFRRSLYEITTGKQEFKLIFNKEYLSMYREGASERIQELVEASKK